MYLLAVGQILRLLAYELVQLLLVRSRQNWHIIWRSSIAIAMVPKSTINFFSELGNISDKQKRDFIDEMNKLMLNIISSAVVSLLSGLALRQVLPMKPMTT